MDRTPYVASDVENEAINILVRDIVRAISQHEGSFDRTFKTIVKKINRTKNMYTILDQSGNEREVKCAIPNANLSVGKHVYCTIPCGNLNGAYISGVL